jgi:hypothetical protein
MGRVKFWINLEGYQPLLDDTRDVAGIQPVRRQVAVTVKPPENRTRVDLGTPQPALKSPDGAKAPADARHRHGPSTALLIGLRSADMNDNAFRSPLKVFHVQPDKLGAAKPTGEPDQQQRSITAADQRRFQASDDGAQQLSSERLGLPLRDTPFPADTAHDSFNRFHAGGQRQAALDVGLSDRHKAPIDGRH